MSGAPGAFTSRCTCFRRSFTCSSSVCDESSALGSGELGEGDALTEEGAAAESVEGEEVVELEDNSAAADAGGVAGVATEGAGVTFATVVATTDVWVEDTASCLDAAIFSRVAWCSLSASAVSLFISATASSRS